MTQRAWRGDTSGLGSLGKTRRKFAGGKFCKRNRTTRNFGARRYKLPDSERKRNGTLLVLGADTTSIMMMPLQYSAQTTSWSPQGMRVLRQCKVSRAEVIFATIQRHIRLSNKERNKDVTMLPNCPMFSVRLWITTSPYRWPIGNLSSTRMLCTSPELH
jgi:hypothetical protein